MQLEAITGLALGLTHLVLQPASHLIWPQDALGAKEAAFSGSVQLSTSDQIAQRRGQQWSAPTGSKVPANGLRQHGTQGTSLQACLSAE